jgi:flavodoxin
MKTMVLYSSRSGNTKKIADEIASELNCESVKIAQTNSTPSIDLNNYDLIFIGTGIRAGNPNEDIIRYLKTIDTKEPKLFAIFITWGGAGKTDQAVIGKLRSILESKGQKVIEDYYTCYGGWKFAFLRRGHPNNEDTKAARNWAKKIMDSIH